MAITNSNGKLFESQRLTDEENGDGRVTGNEVIDGNINNLFQDISRIDRTIGDVALRKAFIGISTDNNDTRWFNDPVYSHYRSYPLRCVELSCQVNGTFVQKCSLKLQQRKNNNEYRMNPSTINNNPSLLSATGSGFLSPSKQYATGSLALKEEGRATHNARSVVTLKGGKPLYHRLCTDESAFAIDEDFVDFAAGSSQSYNEINEAISISRAMYRVFLHNKKSITDENIYDICSCIQAHKDRDYLKNNIPP
ncbi:hypothetical protein [Endozoicomonas sp. SCSIO W0465]|uniref:hypothetical protein n=1 Tax=Endozoicomonas sp. SCSIO W0465 TaxID=2918516 RepID=UPI002076383C|nr:hypothetical protein [Endozoicomonas sp. SCSIO W0465]USE36940.1 hypothetical protein MJO57_01470 [Endozoicomonas sp. SCSIO W0465]